MNYTTELTAPVVVYQPDPAYAPVYNGDACHPDWRAGDEIAHDGHMAPFYRDGYRAMYRIRAAVTFCHAYTRPAIELCAEETWKAYREREVVYAKELRRLAAEIVLSGMGREGAAAYLRDQHFPTPRCWAEADDCLEAVSKAYHKLVTEREAFEAARV